MPCRLTAGTWALAGQFSFILGLQVTVPDGWQSLEQDAGEFNLVSIAHPTDRIFMVKDIAPVTTDGSATVVADIPRTVEGLTAYWAHDPNLAVSTPASKAIAGGIEATTFVIRIDQDAAYIDKECPAYPRCADLFTDPKYWDGPPYGIGAPEVVRMYLAVVGLPAKAHVLVIGLQAEGELELARLEHDAAPILEGLRMPAEITDW